MEHSMRARVRVNLLIYYLIFCFCFASGSTATMLKKNYAFGTGRLSLGKPSWGTSVKINFGRGVPLPVRTMPEREVVFFLGRLPLFVQVLYYVSGAKV